MTDGSLFVRDFIRLRFALYPLLYIQAVIVGLLLSNSIILRPRGQVDILRVLVVLSLRPSPRTRTGGMKRPP